MEPGRYSSRRTRLRQRDDASEWCLVSDTSFPVSKGRLTTKPRFANGTWNHTDPRHCSIHDPEKATCFLNAARRDGFYEASPIVYSQVILHYLYF